MPWVRDASESIRGLWVNEDQTELSGAFATKNSEMDNREGLPGRGWPSRSSGGEDRCGQIRVRSRGLAGGGLEGVHSTEGD